MTDKWLRKLICSEQWVTSGSEKDVIQLSTSVSVAISWKTEVKFCLTNIEFKG